MAAPADHVHDDSPAYWGRAEMINHLSKHHDLPVPMVWTLAEMHDKHLAEHVPTADQVREQMAREDTAAERQAGAIDALEERLNDAYDQISRLRARDAERAREAGELARERDQLRAQRDAARQRVRDGQRRLDNLIKGINQGTVPLTGSLVRWLEKIRDGVVDTGQPTALTGVVRPRQEDGRLMSVDAIAARITGKHQALTVEVPPGTARLMLTFVPVRED